LFLRQTEHSRGHPINQIMMAEVKLSNKLKNKEYHTLGTITKSNIKS